MDGFYPAEWIAETAAGAMSFLANSESIILDLRQNGGGQSGGTLLCSYFFKEETHLTDFYNRSENTTRQFWSYPVAGGEVRGQGPVHPDQSPDVLGSRGARL